MTLVPPPTRAHWRPDLSFWNRGERDMFPLARRHRATGVLMLLGGALQARRSQ